MKISIREVTGIGDGSGAYITTDRVDLIACEYCGSQEHLKVWISNLKGSTTKKIVCSEHYNTPNPKYNIYSEQEGRAMTKDGSNILSYCAPIKEVKDLKNDSKN